METMEKVSRTAIVAELEDAAREIAALYLEAKRLLRTIDYIVQDTEKEFERLSDLIKLLKASDDQHLSIDELSLIEAKLFFTNLKGAWEEAIREQGAIEDLYNAVATIDQKIIALLAGVSEMYYLAYPKDE